MDTSMDNVLDADSSSTKSGRRHSVDTVSTYLSQDSAEPSAGARRPHVDSDDEVFNGGPSGLYKRNKNLAELLGNSMLAIISAGLILNFGFFRC